MRKTSALRLASDDRASYPVGQDAAVIDGDFARELLAGLSQSPRAVPPKYFYDAAGSALFDRICELPEYYPTRTELGILRAHAAELAGWIGPDAEIVEFGAGSLHKVRVLLDALPRPRRFVPIDISTEHLLGAAERLRRDYPGLAVEPVAADFTAPFELPRAQGRRVGFFPGSSIGNFDPAEALSFLRQAATLLREGGEGSGLLIGVDLVKDPALLHAAYNDAAGVTAAFNLNLLARANRELGANFALDGFFHHACYLPTRQRIEMHLVSRREQHVRLCGREFTFAEGEAIHTENSYKYSVAGFRALASQAGFEPGPAWRDPKGLFSLHWLALPAQPRLYR
jgi:dimethylhistidine N-methyltransferase